MTQEELTREIAARAGLTQKVVREVLNTLKTVVSEEVADGNTVSLYQFGVFDSRSRPARMGSHPQTHEPLAIKAKRVAIFTPYKGFALAVSSASL